ncbi:MAG: DUF1566 domain-containing protein [Desulfurivibrionaceae bacterium]|nr:DUF1566 domain-containing protein [Desulfurivibrionaceae bacterium]
MKMVRLSVAICLMFLFCQGCASSPSPPGPWPGGARLMDLGKGICQQKNGLMWQVERSAVFDSPQQVLEYVHHLKLGAYDDWRLPTKEELYELCFLFELQQQGDCPLNLKGSYWSRNGNMEAGAWEAYPLCGGSELRYFKRESGRVRAVRP